VDIAPPAAEARLDDVWRWKRRNRLLADVCRSRFLDTGPAEEKRRRQLVVGGEQRE
jgi:hypothetical protein